MNSKLKKVLKRLLIIIAIFAVIIFASFALLIYSWTESMKAPDRPIYHNISVIKIDNYKPSASNDRQKEFVVIDNAEVVSATVAEINRLSKDGWHHPFGKAPANELGLYLYSGIAEEKAVVSFSLEATYITERGEGYRALSPHGFIKSMDIAEYPQLQKIWCEYHYKDDSNQASHDKLC